MNADARQTADQSELHVDLDALAGNYETCRSLAGSAECAAVVKANGYGLGIEPVVARLNAAGCDHYFVATVAEGSAVRRIAPEARIFVFEGLVAGSEESFAGDRLAPVLNTMAQCEAWARLVETGASLESAALHIDTGMGRLGIDHDAVSALSSDDALMDRIGVGLLMTHLACADVPEHSMNRLQIERFDQARRQLPDLPVSIANSAGIFLGTEWHGDIVRPGVALYGASPTHHAEHALREVAEVRALILQVRRTSAAATVGYGATWVSESGRKLATVAAGYADGYPRGLGNCGVGLVAGHNVPVVGRVSMDLTTFDITDVPDGDVREGDYVTLMGGGIAIDDVADCAGTIAYDLLTSFGSRYRRIYKGDVRD